jgi:hypothetical protein
MVFWESETKTIGEGLTLVRCGRRFARGTEYDRIHGAWWDYTVIEDAKGAIVPSGTACGIARSTVRYLGAIKGQW